MSGSQKDWGYEIQNWIRTTDWDAIEGEGDIVSKVPALVGWVMAGYHGARTVEQRAAAILTLPDRLEPEWDELMRGFLRLERPAAHTPVHRALSKAICVLERDWAGDVRLSDDLDEAMRRARTLARTPRHELEPMIVPGFGSAEVHVGMTATAAIASLGPPDVDERFDDVEERELRYEARGLFLPFLRDALGSVRFSGPGLREGLEVRHPAHPTRALRLPITDASLLAAWGEPEGRVVQPSPRPVSESWVYPGITFSFVESTRALQFIRV